MSTALFLSAREPTLERHLVHDGFEMVADGPRLPDVVITEDGPEVERWSGQTPVIVLGRDEGDAVDRVHAFRRGCDDYVARPFDYDELVERIRAVLRRSRPPAPETLCAGPIHIDLRTRIVSVGGGRIVLAKKEYLLLLKLASEPQRVFTKEELLRDVWGYHLSARTRTLDSHASRVRRKLRELDPTTLYVDNVWGVGYRLLGVTPEQ